MDKDSLQVLIGKNLKKYRHEHHLTQEKLAEKAGISTSYFANLESGKKAMSLIVLLNLAEALQINIFTLLYQEQSDARLQNIIELLQDQPDYILVKMEKSIRFLLEEFVSPEQTIH